MAKATEFQQQVLKLGKLIAELEAMPDQPAKIAAGEAVRLLMDMHGAGIERMMEIVYESPEPGAHTIDVLGNDPIVRSLLLLYSLHPQDLQTRLRKALEALGPRLRKLNASVSLLSGDNDAVQLRIELSGHTCGSTVGGLRSMIEDGIYEYVPDLPSLTILDPEEQHPSGFVALETLTTPHVVRAAVTSHPLAVGGAD